MRAHAGVDTDQVAAVVERLGVLLDAGIASISAWRHAAEGSGSPVAEHVAASIRTPLDVPGGVAEAVAATPQRAGRGEPWLALAAAWAVAVEAGAPIAPALRRMAQVLRETAQSERDIEAALAGPIASGRIVLALPVVGILFALALGVDTLGVLVGSPPGWACLALGGGLVLLGRRWTSRLVQRAQRGDAAPGLALELTAIAVGGGAALPSARRLVQRSADEAGLPLDLTAVDEVLAFAQRAGVPVGALLRSEAESARRAARSAAQGRASALGVQLMLPLGICVLPAFIVLGVVPVMLALVSSTVRGF